MLQAGLTTHAETTDIGAFIDAHPLGLAQATTRLTCAVLHWQPWNLLLTATVGAPAGASVALVLNRFAPPEMPS